MVDHTSQLSRMAQSPAATDLSGGKASEALSTVRRSNLAAEDAVCFQSDLFLDAVASTWTGPGTTGLPASSVRGSDRNGVVHVLSDPTPREMEAVGVVSSPTSGRGGGQVWSILPPSASPPPQPNPLSARNCGRGCKLVSPPFALPSLPPRTCPVPITDRETD